MSRAWFGGGVADFVIAANAPGDPLRLSAAVLTLWDAETGGSQITDLVLGGAAVASIPVGTDGQIPSFQGPDGVYSLWADGGAGGVRSRLDAVGSILEAAGGVTDGLMAAAFALPDGSFRNDVSASIAGIAVPRWAPGQSVATDELRTAPDGSIITRTASGTTRSTFDATEQAAWTAIISKAGTLEQVALDATVASRVLALGTTAGTLVYQHPRGAAEEAGETTYSNAAFVGHGYQMLWSAGGSFNQVLFRVKSSATTEDLRVRVYQVDNATGFTPAGGGAANSTLKADVTVPAALVPHGASPADLIVSLGTTVTIAAGKYVMLVFTTATAGALTIGRFLTDPSTDRYRLFLMTSATAGSLASTTNFFSPAFRLLNGDPAFTSVAAQAATAVSAAATAQVQAATALNATSETASTVYENVRGPSERAGAYTYQVAGYDGFALQQLIPSAVTFNEMIVRLSTVANADVTMKLFQVDTVSGLNLAGSASSVLKHTQVLPGSSLPSAATLAGAAPADVDIVLSAPVSVAAGKYLVAVFLGAATDRVAVRRYDTNPDGDRPKFYLITAPSTATITGSTYLSTSFTLINSSPVSRAKTAAAEALAAAEEAALNGAPPPRVFLPPVIHAVTGDTLQVFTRSVIEHPDPYGVPSVFQAAKGSCFPRFFEWTPVTGDAGTDVPLTAKVYANDGTTVAEATSTIKVKTPANPATLKRTMMVGDSTMQNVLVGECRRRLVGTGGTPAGLGLTNYAFQGNQPITGAAGEGYFGYGGWTPAHWTGSATRVAYWLTIASHDKDSTDQKAVYLDANGKKWFIETVEAGQIKMIASDGALTIPPSGTLTWVSGGTHHSSIVYTAATAAASTPFWDPTANGGAGGFSIKYWCDTYDSGHYPDLIELVLGLNNLTGTSGTADDFTSVAADYRVFLDKAKAEFPSVKIHLYGLCPPSPDGGLGTNYGASGILADYFATRRQMNGYNLMLKALAQEAAYSSWVTYIGQGSQFDSEYNYQHGADTKVNTRNTTFEKRGSNGIHPDTPGYYQQADTHFRAIIHALS